jgi:hypothetical protein
MSCTWRCWSAALLLLGMGSACAAQDEEMKASKEIGGKMLNTHFGRYPLGTKNIFIELIKPQGVRFILSAESPNPEQVGLYSYFSVAGDFEISCDYEWTPVEVPKKGDGLRCGLAIELDSVNVEFARGNFPGKGSTYVVTLGRLVDGKKVFKPELWFPTNAKTGRMAFRREKKELLILTADGMGELIEQERIPFTTETVRKGRFFADPGGVRADLNVRLSNIVFRAAEITTDVPLSEQEGTNWWLIIIGLVMVGVVAALVTRHIRQRD